MDANELARRAIRVLRETRPGSSDRVLVAVVNNRRDLAIAREQGWYRIPVKRAPRRVGADYLAFYLTGAFPEEQRHRVLYYAPIRAYRLATRAALLPDEADHPRAQDSYFKIEIGPLQPLARPVVSRKLRRITFIPTTLDRLLHAKEINDLWDKGTHHDALWAALKAHDIEAERYVEIQEAGTRYVADFLIPCPGGPVIVMCDVEQRAGGANVLCFTANELRQTAAACVQRVCQTIERLRTAAEEADNTCAQARS